MRIEIEVPEKEIALNSEKQKRQDAANNFKKPDRVPVMYNIGFPYIMAARGQAYGDYFQNPETQVKEQLLNAKWRIEHLADDSGISQKALGVFPDLQNVRGGYFPVQVQSAPGELPRTLPLLKSADDIDRLGMPAPTENIYGMRIQWYHAMKEIVKQYQVTLNGKPLEIKVNISVTGGPFPDAFALAGENIFLWMYESPGQVHKLMDTVTTAFINYENYTKELTGRTWSGPWMGCDAAEMMSPEMYAEFVVPYYNRCYETFKCERTMHMCGKIDHLLETIHKNLKLKLLNGFGFVTDPMLLAKIMGGSVVLKGGIDINVLQNGPVDAIKKECKRYLKIFDQCGGFILQCGGGIPPGTPIPHIQAMRKAAEEFTGE